MKRLLQCLVVLFVLVLSSCSKNAENEHLPEYCQSYTGFAATASRDLFELLDEADYSVNRFNYLSVISEIELEFELDDPNRTIDLGGIQCFQNLTSLSLIGRSFKDISEISALSNIQSIELRNTNIVSIDSFKNLSKINNLVISETKTLQNVEGVGEMTKLTTLDLSNNGLVNIGELNALVNLQHLYLNNNEIVYFPSINQLEQLETLDISYNNIIELGPDLSGLRNLEVLQASHNELCDISSLDDLESVETLDLSHNDLGCNGIGVSPNFDSLENAPNLSTLLLNDNGLTSIEGLRDRDISLEVLHLHNNQLTDITPISAYTNITELILYNNNISNIDDLSGMTGLTSIDLSGNNISDFSDLLLITNLTTIDLSDNNISTIIDISGEWPSLSVLDMHSNPLVDVSGVQGHPTLESLILYNSGLTELEGISELPELSLLVVETPQSVVLPEEDINPNNISILRDSFYELPRLSIHTDHVLDLGFDFGPNVEIYNSIQGNITVDTINWSLQDINVIDSTSIQLPNLAVLDVSTNNLTDISFILGNPNLTELYVSNNAITNLSVINGVGHEDLDELEIVHVRNNFIGNDLTNAFIELPRLEEVDLLNTALTNISGSFNGLDRLEDLILSTVTLQSIVDSFNDLYEDYSSTNVIQFSSGRIGTITNSFNGGQYHTISIVNQNPIGGVTTITDSFNDLNIVDDVIGLQILQSDYNIISGSFHNLLSDMVVLRDNDIDSIVTSFVEAEIEVLDVSLNNLTDMPGLNLVTSLNELNISNNHLSTVSFIDGITDLDTLDFSIQETNPFSKTLTTIDGINNQPLLTELIGDLSAITSVSGFKQTGIDELNLSSANLDGSIIDSIATDAFTGSPLTVLDLSGHELDDPSFLANLDQITDLTIGLDVANLDFLSGLPMEDTLQFFAFENASPLDDFGPLSTYDLLTTVALPANTVDITNLDGMDSLDAVILPASTVETITNSFNELPEFEQNQNYLSSFTALTTITGSFDIFGHPDNVEDRITLDASYTVIDSFHNVLEVTLENNGGDLVPNFDTDSFPAMTSLFLQNGEYSTYNFLNGYAALNTLTIANLDDDLIGLNNSVIIDFSVLTTDPSVSSMTYDIAPAGTVSLPDIGTFGSFDIDANHTDFDINGANADITLVSDSSVALNIDADTEGFELIAPLLPQLNIGTFTVTDLTLQTPLLSVLARQSSPETNADSVVINSDQVNLIVTIETDSLTINADNLTTLNSVNLVGDTTIVGTESTLDVNHQGESLVVVYDTLEVLNITEGSIDDVILDSSALQTIDIGSVAIDTINITSDQAIMAISAANVNTVTMTNNNITNYNANVPGATLEITSTSTTLTIENTSTIQALDLSQMTNLNTLNYGSAQVNTIQLDSTSSTMSISGTTVTSISYASTALSTLNVDASFVILSLIESQASLTVDGLLDQLSISSDTLDSLTLNALSDVNEITISSGATLSSIDTNDSPIDLLLVNTDDTSFSLDAVNSSSTTINGNSLNSAVLDVGSNDVTLNTGTGAFALTATANQLDLNATITGLTVDDASIISTLSVDSNSLSSITSGTASISTLEIIDSATSFTLNGTSIAAATLSSNVNDVTFAVGPTTSITMSTTSVTPVTVDTSTESIDITAVTDIDITGSALESVIFDVGNNDLSIDMDAPTLSASLSGTAGTVSVTGDDIDAITLEPETSINTLELTNLDVTTLDTTGINVSNLDMTTAESNLTLTVPNVTGITINGDNLTTLDITNNTGIIDLTSNQASLTVTGTMDTLTIDNPTLTSLSVTGATIDILDLSTASLGLFDSEDSIATSLTIDTNQNNFDLTSQVSDITFTSDPTNSLLFATTSTGEIALNSDTNQIDLDAPSTTVTINAPNLVSLLGDVDTVDLSGFTSFAFVLNVDATTISISDPGTLTSLSYTGVHTIDTLDVLSGSIAIIDTNDVVITSLLLEQNTTVPLDVTTLADDITITAQPLGGFTDVTINYEGASSLSIAYTDLNIGSLNLSTTDTVVLSGTVNDITITGGSLSSLTTTGLSVSGDFTMNNTAITTIDFASTFLLSSLTTLEMNTLSDAFIEDILTALDGPTLELISPIELTDISDYYYTTQLAALIAQETIDNAYYDSIRATAVDDSWAEILLNEYMDHLDELSTKTDIDADDMDTVENYFQSYLTDAGLEVGDLAPGEETTIRDAIQATLDDIVIIMDETTLQNAKDAAIDADALDYATTQTAAITFTIG